MRILINALSARQGGGQTYLRHLLAHAPKKPDLEILVYAPISLRLPECEQIRRRIVNWPTQNPILRTMWEILALPRIIAAESVQVLFCPGGVITTPVPASCKTVTMFRNMMPFDAATVASVPCSLQRLRNVLLKRAMLRSMERADLTIFVSNHARRVIEALIRVGNPVTIPHGISNTFRTHTQKMPRPDWVPTGEYLLYVSRFDVYKHQYEVVSAFAALPPDLKGRYKLLLVGELDKALVCRVTKLASDKGIEDRIRIVGPVAHADLAAAYHHASVNLFASSCENCPNILLEALGAGRPVLSSDVMPMPEFGLDAVDYFSPTDPASIVSALVRVLRDDARRDKLAAKAALRSADFDWANTAQRTWQHITRLIAQ